MFFKLQTTQSIISNALTLRLMFSKLKFSFRLGINTDGFKEVVFCFKKLEEEGKEKEGKEGGGEKEKERGEEKEVEKKEAEGEEKGCG